MIKPIENNVVFKGENFKRPDNFKGTMPVVKSVRGDYETTVNSVVDMQNKMQNNQSSDSLGKNVNTIV